MGTEGPAQIGIGLAQQMVQVAAVTGPKRVGKGQKMLAMAAYLRGTALQGLHAIGGQARAVDRAGTGPATLALHGAAGPSPGCCAMVPHRLPGQAYCAIRQLLPVAQHLLERMPQHGNALRSRIPGAIAIWLGDGGQAWLGIGHAPLHCGRVIDGEDNIGRHRVGSSARRRGGQLQGPGSSGQQRRAGQRYLSHCGQAARCLPLRRPSMSALMTSMPTSQSLRLGRA